MPNADCHCMSRLWWVSLSDIVVTFSKGRTSSILRLFENIPSFMIDSSVKINKFVIRKDSWIFVNLSSFYVIVVWLFKNKSRDYTIGKHPNLSDVSQEIGCQVVWLVAFKHTNSIKFRCVVNCFRFIFNWIGSVCLMWREAEPRKTSTVVAYYSGQWG